MKNKLGCFELKFVKPISNVALLPCQTQFINYKYIRIHVKVC